MTQAALNFAPARAIRANKRGQIELFFRAHLGERFSSAEMHSRFGSAFRTRVSELNREADCPIRICNRTDERDHSVYWSEAREGR